MRESDTLDEEALGGFAVDDGGTGIAAFGEELGAVHAEVAFGLFFVVTFDTTGLKKGLNVLLKVDGRHFGGGGGGFAAGLGLESPV